MHLSNDEQSMLAGEAGVAVRKAMEILVTLGKIFHADQMVPVQSAQIAGVSYQNIGEPGIDFLQDWAAMGARSRIPAFMNPAGIDRDQWQQLGIPTDFAARQNRIIDLLAEMGVERTLTCTPYHIGHVPSAGAHIAWSESSAVSYANSVLGARTNREGGPSALAAAITGRTPCFGLHIDYNRRATHRIRICTTVAQPAEYGLIGYLVGKIVGQGIPCFDELTLPDEPWQRETALKTLGAAMAASGAVALYHIRNFTPDILEQPEAFVSHDMPVTDIDDLRPAIQALRQHGGNLDLVALGCPHSSFDQLKDIAATIAKRGLKTPLWVTTSAAVKQAASETGLAEAIESAGGKVVADTCMVVAPLQALGIRYIGVDSAKAACYLPSHQGTVTYWGTTEQCIESAIEGKWLF